MELHVHMDLCEVLLEDLLRQVANIIVSRAARFEGVLLVAVFLLAYLLIVETQRHSH